MMKRRLLWIVELFIWLLILFLVSGAVMFVKYNYRKNFYTYQMFLPDVDGLINGSPVKFMGIQVGYVNQLDIVGEDVYVKFIITESNIRIPAGSRVTVEFSGLGGSKSLEIYPPKAEKNPSGKLLIPQKPKRIHDSLGLLNDMFDKIIDITFTVSNFMNKAGIISSSKNNYTINGAKNASQPADAANDFLNFSNDWLDKAQKQCNIFNNKIDCIRNGKKNRKNGEKYGGTSDRENQ